jgi:streptogramin lyase
VRKAGLIAGLLTFALAAAPAAAKKGDLIVAGYSDNTLVRVDPRDGSVDEIYGGAETDSVSYLTLEPSGTAAITDENGGGVWRINLTSGVISEVAPAAFQSPYGIDRAPSGDLHIGDYSSGLLSRVDRKSEELETIGPADGDFVDSSYGMDVLSNGTTLFANTDDPEGVIKLTQSGDDSLFISHPDLGSPQDVARLPNGDVFVLNGDGDLYRFRTKTGETSLAVPDVGAGSSYSLAPTPDGSVYVSSYNGRIDRVDPKTGDIDEVLPDGELQSIVGMELEPPKCKGKLATIVGSTKRDKLKGSRFADVIVGLNGNDKIKGGKGKDRICGGKGKDKLQGGKGKDKLDGGPGKDKEQQ